MKVIVVGGGIMGLCTAWGLHRLGHRPVVHEQGPLPNPLGSSVDRSRVIRFTYGDRAGYARMVADAYAGWEALWRDLGPRRRYYAETGTLAIVRGDDAWLRATRGVLADLRVPYEDLTPSGLAERCPFLDADDAAGALFTPTGGLLAAERIVADLAADLRDRGVEVRERSAVREVDPARAAVRLADGGEDSADALVVAAGPWAPRLLPAPLGGRVVPSRQVTVYLTPPADHRDAWRRAPTVLDGIGAARDRGEFYVVPPALPGDEAIKVGDHHFSLQGEPDREREPTPADVDAVAGLCRGRLRDFERYRVAAARTCFYSVTGDERFIAERVERAWVLAGFSGHGFKFGASMGLATAEAIDGRRAADDLRAYAAGSAPA